MRLVFFAVRREEFPLMEQNSDFASFSEEQKELADSVTANVVGKPRESGDGRDPDEIDFESYVFPDTKNRAITSWFLLVMGTAAVLVWVFFRSRTEIWNDGVLLGGIVLLVLALYFRIAAFPLGVNQGEALFLATKEAGFPVGHASAMLGFRGWRSRPSWRILLFSVEDPPLQRGLVELDGITGEILGVYSEENPDPETKPPSDY